MFDIKSMRYVANVPHSDKQTPPNCIQAEAQRAEFKYVVIFSGLKLNKDVNIRLKNITRF